MAEETPHEGLATEKPEPVSGLQEEHYYQPGSHKAPPLTGDAPLPRVKRFNKTTVLILAGITAFVLILALSSAFTKKTDGKKTAENDANTTAAQSSTPDAVTALPSDYAAAARMRDEQRVPKLGAPLPGDVGAMAVGANGVAGTINGQPRALTPYEQLVAEQKLEELRRESRAHEAGFAFTGGVAGSGASDPVDAGRGLNAGNYGRSAAADSVVAITGAQTAQALASRDATNRQDDKTAFAERNRRTSWALNQGMQLPVSPYTMFAGTILPGVMTTGINSDLPGQIEGQISQNVYDTVTGKHLLLPQGTKVLGTYDSRVTYGQTRVLVVWTRLIRPDGSNIDLEGMPGVDLSGYAGLTGKVDRHLTRLLGAVLLGSVIQAGANAGTNYTNPSFTQLARQGAGQGVNDATQQIVQKEINIQPTIVVAPGSRFNVFTTKDIVLPPYAG